MKILFLSRWYPFPADNGSKLRIYNLLQGLAEQHELTLLTFGDQKNTTEHAPELAALCEEICVVPWRPYNPNSWRAKAGYFSLKPRMAVDTYSAEMTDSINRALSVHHPELIIASEFNMAMYSAHFCGVPAILEDLELGTYYGQFQNAHGWRRLRYGLTWHKHRYWLARTLKDFRACTMVSRPECQLARRVLPTYSSFELIPNCVRLDDYRYVQESPVANTLIFTGSFSYLPNYEAMCWFLREVFPLVLSQLPEVHLTITGNHCDLPLPLSENVTLTGYVDDVRPYIARSWASIVPIQRGGGTRLKILEAMALRTPVVATSKGAEGIDAGNGEHILLGDSPQEFSQALIQLLQVPALRQQLADKAYCLVQESYNWQSVLPHFLQLVEKIADTKGHI